MVWNNVGGLSLRGSTVANLATDPPGDAVFRACSQRYAAFTVYRHVPLVQESWL